MHHTTAVRVLALGAAALVLAGCAATAPSDPTTPHPNPSASATEPAAELAIPVPAFDLDCADLASDADIAAAFGPGLAAHDVSESELRAAGFIPSSDGLAQAGGLACEWSNGEPYSETLGSNTWTGVRVQIDPDAASEFQALVDYQQRGSDETLQCSDAGCFADSLVANRWVNWNSRGGDPATLGQLFERIAAAVAAAPDLPSAWAPPSGTRPIPSSCADLIDVEAVQTLLALDEPVYPEFRDGPAVGFRAASAAHSGAVGCLVMNQSGTIPITVSALPGGEWALDAATPVIDPSVIDVDGMRQGDRAGWSCREWACQIDLLLGHNWIQIRAENTVGGAHPGDPVDPSEVERRARGFADLLVAAVYPS